MLKKSLDYRLYLVTDKFLLSGRDLCQCLEKAIIGGITLLQLREKELSTLDFFKEAQKTKELAGRYNIPLIINDRMDIALAVNADGLHIGQDDMPLDVARKFLGAEKIIGVSVSTVEEAIAAEQNGADYLGVGAVFATSTKGDADSVSLEELKRIKAAVSIPVVAIGGINYANAADVIAAGVDGIAVVSAILGKEDITKAAYELINLFK